MEPNQLNATNTTNRRQQLFLFFTTPVHTPTIICNRIVSIHSITTRCSKSVYSILSVSRFSNCSSTVESWRSMSTKERKILVAVDEGEESTYALSWCLENVVSENSKDTLILLYVKPPQVVYTALDGTGYLFSPDIIATMDKYRNQVAETVIEKAKKLCKDLQDVKVETRVEHGDPRDVICDAAEKMAVDVVVLGSHGYGLIKRAFLGSVSNHCAQNIKRPVLIVKRPKPSAATSTSSS